MSTSALSLSTEITLNDGVKIPQLGLGVYEMTDEQVHSAVTWALEAGYRHIDTAKWYENEKACTVAIEAFMKNHSVPRSEIFYTTKLKYNEGYEKTVQDIKDSVALAPSGLIDLYLMHSAIGGPEKRLESWKACEEAKKRGEIRSIGVSNFGLAHIDEFVSNVAKGVSTDIPSINQIDLHPFMNRPKIVEACMKAGIVLEAWAPLVRGERFDNPVVAKIAAAYKVTPAQVLIRWSLQKGFVCIPKSVSQARIVANSSVYDFNLSPAEMEELCALEEYLLTDWDVTETP